MKHSTVRNLLQSVADAIRETTGTTDTIIADDFPDVIKTIETGIDTSDATAAASDILKGKSAYVNGEKVTGTYEPKGTSIWEQYNIVFQLKPFETDNNTSFLLHSESIEDSSNNNYTITNSGITITTDGKMGSALSTGNNKYLNLPAAAFSLGWSSWTLEGWFYLTAYPSTFQGMTHTVVYYKGESGTDERISFTSSNRFVIAQYYDGAQYSNAIDLTSEMPLNQWFHLAIVRDGSNLRIYLDGTLAGTKSDFSISDAIFTSNIFLFNDGISTVQGARGIQGKIDEFRVSNVTRYNSNFDVADRNELEAYVVSDDVSTYPEDGYQNGYYYKLLYSKET